MPSASASRSPVTRTELRVGGLAPLSSCDWPGELVATVFTRGCPFDCPYCHNPHLLEAGAGADDVAWADVVALLRARRGLLDGVVFSGGEPTVQPALADAIREVRELGFRVGLHTAGPIPERLEAVLGLVDWVGFDVKAPFGEYERVTRVPGSGERVLASLRALVASGVAYEARTTVHPDLLDSSALERLAAELAAEGVTDWAVQAYRPVGARPGLAGVTISETDVPVRARERFASFVFRPA
jgi:pyruvate formate lyase activating enzyme